MVCCREVDDKIDANHMATCGDSRKLQNYWLQPLPFSSVTNTDVVVVVFHCFHLGIRYHTDTKLSTRILKVWKIFLLEVFVTRSACLHAMMVFLIRTVRSVRHKMFATIVERCS